MADKLDKAIAVATRDPAWYGIDEAELERWKKWTSNARNQVGTMWKSVEAGNVQSNSVNINLNATRQELMRSPNDHSYDAGRSNRYGAQDNDEFISSESDKQMHLMKRQDEELDEFSASVQRIGGVGLTIHEELKGQEKILEELSLDMDSTANCLDFVQEKILEELSLDMDSTANCLDFVQVSRMLLGGMNVVGLYIWAAESSYKTSSILLWQMMDYARPCSSNGRNERLN